MRNFKFFHGLTTKLRAEWSPITGEVPTIDVENELINILSEELSREIDRNVVEMVTRRINGGNDNLDYFNRWMDIGNNRA